MNSSFVLLFLLPLFFGLALAKRKDEPSPTYTSSLPLSPSSFAFSRGQMGSDVTVDLWIDLACSDCMNGWPVINDVWEAYGDKVKFNYR
ncbi:hypothetical protein TrRE_jg7767 [Triparma retinervis]|uniref:Uncharacterized protein n=1 Tax=Triparma retinervis TaxID=2557542 RepID=A0A9W7FDT7_9STRA|nr:hypothetical protein TrRE_jg7767 [Triparma retinervis]